MESKLKTLFVKQHLDLLGPRSSFNYNQSNDRDILKAFPGKVSLFELISFFEADFLISPTRVISPWMKTLMQDPDYQKELETSTTNIIDVNKVDLSKYDLVITHDPFLLEIRELKTKFPNTVFAYILAEHSSWQMHELGFDYDLYLDHTLNSVDKVVRLPQAINFLFPRVPNKIRKMFNDENTTIFFDYRTLGHFISGGSNNVALNYDEVVEYIDKVSKNFPLPFEYVSQTSLKPYMFNKENENDSIKYYAKLYRSKYFVSIANRVGQAAFDAASAGALVIGTDRSALHNKLCHPIALVSGKFTEVDILNVIQKLESDKDLYDKALKHQEDFLSLSCIEHPQKIIQDACKIKRS